VLSEKIRVLLQAGLKSEAEYCYKQIEQLTQENNFPALLERQKSIKSKIEFFAQDSQVWLQGLTDSSYIHDPGQSQLQYLLMTMHDSVHFDQFILNSYPLGRLRWLEHQLINLKQRTSAEVWPILNDMELLLDHVSEPVCERVALYLMMSTLKETSSEKKRYRRMARLELARWGCDREIKRPLEVWLAATEKGVSPLDFSEWDLCLEGLKDRWHNWMQGFMTFDKDDLEVLTNATCAIDNPFVVIDESLGEVYVNDNLDKTLSRSSSLRNILIFLIENSP